MRRLFSSLGRLLSVTGIFALTCAGIAALQLCSSLLSARPFHEHVIWLAVVLITSAVGLGFTRLGTLMCRDRSPRSNLVYLPDSRSAPVKPP